MISSLGTSRAIWVLTGVLTLIASAAGIALPDIYRGLVPDQLLPGGLAQDLISLLAGISLIAIAVLATDARPKSQIVALGILGYLFYAYGIFVIERAYNGLYLVYLAVFTLAFWGMVSGGVGIRPGAFALARLPRRVRLVSASGSLLPPVVFIPLWISALLPLMAEGNRIDSLYSVYILDLAFIMPAFFFMAVSTFRSHGLGLLLSPALFTVGFTLILSLALAEVVKPWFGMPSDSTSLLFAGALSALFFAVGVLHLRGLSLTAQAPPP